MRLDNVNGFCAGVWRSEFFQIALNTRRIGLFLWGALLVLLTGCSTLGDKAEGAQPFYPNGPFSPLAQMTLQSSPVQGLQPPRDLWGRIRRGFAIPDLKNEEAQERTQWYASHPESFERMTERANKYLFYIVEELERRNMPTELALLPFVESAFDPSAISHAKAAGMWQFMPATGTYFDLKQDAFRDERRDVMASTRAALDYLSKLYDMFGDWHLALAAYNWGEGSVGRALAKNQNEGKGLTYEDINMPAETRLYVPKLQALKNIIANPRQYGVALAPVGNHPFFDLAPIPHDMDVELVAKLAGIEASDFRALNPAHNGPVIFAAITKEVLLPWDNAQIYRQNLASYRGKTYASWTVWRVPQTMSVAQISQKIGVPANVIRSVNAIPANVRIGSGSALLVPRAQTVLADTSAELLENAQLKLRPAAGARRIAVKARRGETVGTLAKRYGVSAGRVAAWNKVGRNARFRAGQRLVIYR